MKQTILLLSLLFSVFSVFGQDLNAVSNEPLPRYLTEAEKLILKDYYSNYNLGGKSGIEAPPGGSIRIAAEWEEVQTLVLTWTGQYNNIQAQIVDAAQEECRVLIACTDSNTVKNTLSNKGVPDINLEFIEVPYNSIWIRDYGGNTMYRNDVDSLFLVDWIYNRPRPNDDVMPEAHAAWHNIPIYATTAAPNDLVNTGGNWMSDGLGNGFASELILEDNGSGSPYTLTIKNEAQIDAIVNAFEGVDRYTKMTVLPYDGIHHIDMHMKLLDEETLLVAEYPTGVADGPQIEANLQYILANYNSVFGTPYKVVRIPSPPDKFGDYPNGSWNGGDYCTYTNGVFVNKTFLFPLYYEEYDTTAIRIYEESLPGYNVIGIDVDENGENLISLSGAIHCITHTIGVEDPMLIIHQSLEDTYDDVNPYQVTAEIQHRTGISGATMYWGTSAGGPYSPVNMTNTSGNTWSASIPAQIVGTKVYYYIEGNANSGKTQVRPITAPAGYFDFEVLGGVGLNELSNVDLQDVYPNPASAITCIPVSSLNETNAVITLQDISGKVVETIFNGVVPSGDSKYFFFADKYAAGSYMVVIETQGTRMAKKVMIK